MPVVQLVNPDLRANLQAALSAHIDSTDTSHDLAHANRVCSNAQLIASNEGGADLRVLIAAAYLHDLVSLPKDHPDRSKSSAYSANAAAPILRDLGYTSAEIASVRHAITAHSFSANIPPKTPEAKILQDADRLDALGAIGIARTFAVSGALGRPLYDVADPFAQTRALDDARYSIDHWPKKLLCLPAMMNTNTGKSLAAERLSLMGDFLKQLATELGITLPKEWGGIA